jgi:hypothetical protein
VPRRSAPEKFDMLRLALTRLDPRRSRPLWFAKASRSRRSRPPAMIGAAKPPTSSIVSRMLTGLLREIRNFEPIMSGFRAVPSFYGSMCARIQRTVCGSRAGGRHREHSALLARHETRGVTPSYAKQAARTAPSTRQRRQRPGRRRLVRDAKGGWRRVTCVAGGKSRPSGLTNAPT